MKLRIRFSGYYEVNSLQEVMLTLTQLGWTEEEDDFLICNDTPNGFVQIAKWRPGQYIVEWCAGADSSLPQQGLHRVCYPDSPSEVVEFGHQEMGQFNLYQNELLSLSDTLDVLTSLWRGHSWPNQVCLRDLNPEMRKFRQLNAERHATMTLRG